MAMTNLAAVIAAIRSTVDPQVALEVAACWTAAEVKIEIRDLENALVSEDAGQEDKNDAKQYLPLYRMMTVDFRRFVKSNYDAIEAAIY